jgi:hypothetical protein
MAQNKAVPGFRVRERGRTALRGRLELLPERKKTDEKTASSGGGWVYTSSNWVAKWKFWLICASLLTIRWVLKLAGRLAKQNAHPDTLCYFYFDFRVSDAYSGELDVMV